MDEQTRIRAAALFAALGHPTRIRMVEHLTTKEMSVGEVASVLKLAQSSASQHLAALFRSGVLDVSQKGTSRLYRVRGPRIERILKLITEFCEVQGLKGEPNDEFPDF